MAAASAVIGPARLIFAQEVDEAVRVLGCEKHIYLEGGKRKGGVGRGRKSGEMGDNLLIGLNY